jgi:N-formylglutamate amidohydrolase
MNFKEEINELENLELTNDYKISMGNIPILFTAPHTMEQVRSDGSIKKAEPYTKAIALYLNKHMNTYSMIKLQDTGLDSNRDNHDDFKNKLLNLVDEHNIKLVIDLHGASVNREFDVEFGTMNNLTADFSTINELKEAFIENGITRISFNNPFKGGAITQYLYNKKDIDVIQLEINYKYRDYSNLENLKLLIESLSNFIKQYKEYRER